jgi:O-succinylbenzoic acid--CoA ligase
VREAFVVGVDDPEWGQALAAAVVLAAPEGSAGEQTVPEDIRAAAAERLGRLAPKSWLALESLPLLPNGKPDRRALTELLAARHRRP